MSVFGIKSFLSGAMNNSRYILMLERVGVGSGSSTKKFVSGGEGNEKEGLKKRFTEL